MESRGIHIAIFLDDGLAGGADPVSAQINSLVEHLKTYWSPT